VAADRNQQMEENSGSFMLPCEMAARYVLPAIRAALAVVLTDKYGLTSYRVAKILNLTPAAITNYRKGKRGNKLVEQILSEPTTRSYIEEIAKAISSGGDGLRVFREKTCDICQTVRGEKCDNQK